MINEPKIVEIKEIIDETPTIKTFKFDWDMEKLGRPNPGEFVMVWNFQNEKPMSISQINDNELAITVKNIGKFTSQLHELSVGIKLVFVEVMVMDLIIHLKVKTLLLLVGVLVWLQLMQ